MQVKTQTKTIEDFYPLSGAEEYFVEKCCAGELAILADDQDRTIRGELVRYFLLGGCEQNRPTEAGVLIANAVITGKLDFSSCRTHLTLLLKQCTLEQSPDFSAAHLNRLSLEGSTVPGMFAEELSIEGSVFLRSGFTARGEVSLYGAKIGGQLACNNGTFENKKGTALIAQNIDVKGSIFLEGFTCTSGTIDFQFAKVGAIAGGFASWPEARFFINGLTYETIFARDINADTMLNWLSGHKTDEFKPQPYEQMAKVLKTLGHRRDASLILEAMEKQLRPEIRNRMRVKKLDGTWSMAFTSLWLDIKRPMTYILDMFQGVIVGYGYRPSRAFVSSVFIMMFATCVAFQTWHAGDMVPNSPILLVEGEWKEFASDRNANAAKEWTEKADAGRDYETFNPFVYALDVFVPIIDFGQERAWAPSTERGWWGRQLYWMRWLFKVFGWIITALSAAAVTGIIRQDR